MQEIINYLVHVKIGIDYLDINTLKEIIEYIRVSREQKNKVFILGNGGSALTASHLASDLNAIGIKAISLSDNVALNTAIANDKGWVYTYLEPLKIWYEEGDILITISNFGGDNTNCIPEHSQNLIKAIDYINEKGGITIGLSGRDGGNFNKCKINLIVNSDDVMIIEPMHSIICHLIPKFL